MRLTSRMDYGLKALLDLGLHFGQGPLSNQEISKRQRIPEQYLKQILPALRRRGLINSTRGPGGGHSLVKPPGEITLADIVGALEGGGDFLAPQGSRRREGHLDSGRILDEFWRDVRGAMDEIMERTTLEELCRRQRRRERSITYHI